jgi:uncharacterized membrane protein YdjX (TVP38/TMEM64 family)
MKPALRLSVLIIAALAVPLIPFAVTGELPGERWLSASGGDDLRFALTGAALLAADVLLPVPSSVLGTLLGARLGFLPGLLATFIGLCTGHVLAYVASRWLVRGRLGAMPEGPTAWAVFLSRPVPVLAEAIAIAAGAARLAPGRFALACGAGNLVYAVALAGNGAALLPSAPIGPGLVLPMLLPAVAWWLWRRSRRVE